MPDRNMQYLIRYLNVAVIDGDYDFLMQTTNTLHQIGLEKIYSGMSPRYANAIVSEEEMDVIFLEADRKYAPTWALVREAPRLRSVIVATTLERNACARLSAIEAGAERVIAKDQAQTLLEPMLVHLLKGDLSRRFRVVPFPRTDARR